MNRWIWISGGLLILLGAAALTYIFIVPIVGRLPALQQEDPSVAKTFTHDKYDYSFQYPPTLRVSDTDAHDMIATDQYFRVKVADPSGVELNIEALDIIFLHAAQNQEYLDNNRAAVEAAFKLPVKDLATKIWQINKTDKVAGKEVSELTATALGGRTAYQFTVTKRFIDELGSVDLAGQYVYLFVDTPAGMNLIISYPDDNTVFVELLKSFTFNTVLD